MSHPKDGEQYPIDSIVRITKVGRHYGKFAIITGHAFQFEGKGFLHYEGRIEGEAYTGSEHHALYHDDLELEALPTSPASEHS